MLLPPLSLGKCKMINQHFSPPPTHPECDAGPIAPRPDRTALVLMNSELPSHGCRAGRDPPIETHNSSEENKTRAGLFCPAFASSSSVLPVDTSMLDFFISSYFPLYWRFSFWSDFPLSTLGFQRLFSLLPAFTQSFFSLSLSFSCDMLCGGCFVHFYKYT